MKHVLSDALRRALLASCCFAPLAAPGWAQQAPLAQERVRFDIPAQNLGAALTALAQQSGKEIVIAADSVRGRFARELHGNYTLDEALDALLQGMDLRHRVGGNGTIVVEREAERAGVESSSGNAKDLPTVVVRRPFTDANVDIVRTENDAQPYYIFSGEEIQQSNAATLEDFLKQRLTMNAVAQTAGQSAGGVSDNNGNYSRVNLRGLGIDQTLILVNGRRVTNGGSGGNAASQFDINSFAPTMIERIEVLPASASAIYGGSAVGGVFNIILKRDFTGGEFRVAYDTPLDAHAPVRNVTGAYGWSLEDGRTNISLSASYRDIDSLAYADRRDLLERGYSRVLATSPNLLYSANFPYTYGGTTPNIASSNGSSLVFDDGTPLGSSLTYVPTGASSSTSAAQLQTGLLGNAGLQNTVFAQNRADTGLLAKFSPTGHEKSASAAVRRQMTDRLQLFTEFFYNSNTSSYLRAQRVVVNVPGSSPANPFQQDVTVALPLQQTRFSGFDHSSVRAVGGFVLDLPNDWRAQGDYTWNRSKDSTRIGPNFDAATEGEASGIALANGTLNPFVDTMAYPPDLGPFTAEDSLYRGASVSKLTNVALRVSGPIGSLPAGQPNLTVGLEYRKEEQPWGYDDFGGMSGLTTYLPQSQQVSSLYAELLVPLVAPANAVPGVRLLDLQVAGRLEKFSVGAGTDSITTFPPDYVVPPDTEVERTRVKYDAFNKTIGLRYKPVDSLMLRASFATAFLPPGYSDFVTRVFPFPVGLPDPLRGNTINEFTFQLGGNAGIKPMDAENWNVGLLFEPASWKGVRLNLEWFRIERSNLIFTPFVTQIIENPDLYADRITRAAPAPGDPYDVGPVTFIDATRINAAHVVAEGLDFGGGYRYPTERHGTFRFDVLATRISKFTQQIELGSPAMDIVNRVADGGPLKFRANATLGWERGPWSANWTALYYGSYEQADGSLYIAAQGGSTVPSQIYHNLAAGYRFEGDGAMSGVGIALGIQNLFDTMPPFDAYAQSTQYYSPFGDYRLRSIHLSVSKRF